MIIFFRFRENGFKITPQRVAVFRALENNRRHPSAEEIFRRIRQEHPSVSLTTVYKTLELLRDLGELKEVHVSGERVFYDPNMNPHHHLVCTRCHKILDIPAITMSNFDLPKQKKNFEITDCRVDFFGHCSRCRRDV
jgi:Fur family peroxide stress response transcriptional regulator